MPLQARQSAGDRITQHNERGAMSPFMHGDTCRPTEERIPEAGSSESESTAATDECSICLDTSAATQRVATPCGHVYCQPCLVKHITVRRHAGEKPDCPLCRQALSDGNCRALGAPQWPPSDRWRWLRPSWMVQASELRSLRRLELRHCPSCSAIIQKRGGCSQVRCRCGHGFSWLSAALVRFEAPNGGGVRWPERAANAGLAPRRPTGNRCVEGGASALSGLVIGGIGGALLPIALVAAPAAGIGAVCGYGFIGSLQGPALTRTRAAMTVIGALAGLHLASLALGSLIASITAVTIPACAVVGLLLRAGHS